MSLFMEMVECLPKERLAKHLTKYIERRKQGDKSYKTLWQIRTIRNELLRREVENEKI